MTSFHRPLAAALGTLSLAGCSAAVPAPRSSPPPVVSAPPPTIVRPVQSNSLIGQSPDAVGRLFGKPRLDVTEGAARKLQFEGSACVVDIYFYAPRAGAAPVATHVDARTPDGRSTEPDSCAAALRR
ncbi:hypothetical protein EAO27_18080 [Sphingopyxis sp. YF1]|uniref:hypothetical protein n=1 Tax=Sphingopyxis sp. YF1 TaxID=2482763 RepID=UPI001F61E2CB|nr:hypothetical protein [Sphingopyxis sp. YF1]UNU44402.1 hypothetical protein EAO27_18080 [Sphingopyxis sp. YF1]